MGKKSQRKNPRVDLRIAVQIEQQSRLQQFYSRNLSTGGIFIEVEGVPPPLGSKLNIAFDVPGLSKKIDVEVEVVHQHYYDSMDSNMKKVKKSGIGLKFLNLNPKDQKLITEFITGRGLNVQS